MKRTLHGEEFRNTTCGTMSVDVIQSPAAGVSQAHFHLPNKDVEHTSRLDFARDT